MAHYQIILNDGSTIPVQIFGREKLEDIYKDLEKIGISNSEIKKILKEGSTDSHTK